MQASTLTAAPSAPNASSPTSSIPSNGSPRGTSRDTSNDTSSAASTSLFASLDALLRDRGAFLERIERGADVPSLALWMICAITVGGAAFGAVLGSFRGGVQIAYAAIKLPLVLLVTAALCAPVLAGLRAAVGSRGDLRRDLLLVLSSLALAAMVAMALAPALLLAVRFGLPYHKLILTTVLCCTLSGVTGVAFFLRGLRGQVGAVSIGVVLALVFAVVAVQASWTLRPFLLRPRTTEVTFVRGLEGGFLDSLSGSLRSARGRYFRPQAPLPEPAEPRSRDGAEPVSAPPASFPPSSAQPSSAQPSSRQPSSGQPSSAQAGDASAPR